MAICQRKHDGRTLRHDQGQTYLIREFIHSMSSVSHIKHPMMEV